MPLKSGARVGGYEVVAPLGAGGMGEVYRAHDARLKRDVALKILHEAGLGDVDRRERFAREAQLLASLNHPNLAQVYGVEDADGIPVIVMELVEGATLADRLASGPLPVPEALAIAVEACHGLEAAHERGIVHRDLKPANIKIRPDGSVKILDFGLARALQDEGGADSSQAPTLHATQAGMILGTAAYMSPEQARGKAVDRRTDVWAFGCVLYEMLTGRPAFTGETTTDVLSGVIHQEPDWSRLPPSLSPRVVELLQRCLAKNLRDRQRDIADARFELERSLRAGQSQVQAGPAAIPVRADTPARGWLSVAAPFLAGIAAGAGLVAAFLLGRPAAPPEAPSLVRAAITLPPQTTIALGRGSSVALSPDGRRLVFAGRTKDGTRLYVRALDRFETQAIAGTEGGTNPFFSPDGQWVGFFADRKLKKVSLDGGAPVAVTEAGNARGEAWGDDNAILFTPSNNAGILRVPALGGTPEPVTALAEGELSHRWPRVLPGSSAILFTVWNDTGWEPAKIVAQRAGSRERTVVVETGGGYGRYVRDGSTSRGFLVYARAEGLLAAPFDEARLSLTGQPVPVVDGVVTNLSGGAHFDLSRSGTLAYVPGTLGEANRDLVWVDLDGKPIGSTTVRNMSRWWVLSPDGTRLARNNTTGPNRNIWVEDLGRGTSTRITKVGENFNPVWSRDGKWVYFARGIPVGNLFRYAADGRDVEERLATSAHDQTPSSVSPDGAWLVYSEIDPVSGSDIWVRPVDPAGEGRPFVKTNSSEGNAQFSPDGRWLAYQSNESGRFEVYVRSFPGGEQKVQVSTGGGIWPLWAPSGELLYRAADGKLMWVPVTSPARDLRPDGARALFDATPYEAVFGIGPEGKRLLMMRLIDAEQSATEVRLVVNFLEELRRRVR